MINCVALSDLHGTLPIIEQPFDLMLIAGDAVDLYCQKYSKLTEDWYLGEFMDWINSLPFKDEQGKVILIAGNHCVGLENMKPSNKQMFLIALRERSNHRIIYLENELYNFHCRGEQVSIFGTPWCKIFGNWAFMGNPELLKEKYSEIPEGIDILLSHDAPYGTCDVCHGWIAQGRIPYHIGNEQLRDVILDKKPKMCLVGHLHSANHDFELLGDTKVRNVSILDEEYKETYKPFYFEWPSILD